VIVTVYFLGLTTSYALQVCILMQLALTSSTSGGRSVGIVRSRTQATEFSFFLVIVTVYFLGLTTSYSLQDCLHINTTSDSDGLLPRSNHLVFFETVSIVMPVIDIIL
jgi:hypothetical protein